MTEWIVLHEALLRGGAFVAVFALIAAIETVAEGWPLRVSRRRRWVRNLSLMALNTIVLRLLLPIGATAAALWAGAHGTGLLRLIDPPPPLEFGLSIVLLDLVIYAQHRLFHSVPILFRFHKVHHADLDFDVTLGSRFHPVEMLLSMLIKITAVVAIGASAPAVVLFEMLLAATSLFNHGNVRIPSAIDRVLRCLVVTPAMHSVHHSAEPSDRDTNFGFNIPWWDRLFGTYRHRSTVDRPAFGMDEHQTDVDQTLRWMLALPFRSTRESSPVESHQEAA